MCLMEAMDVVRPALRYELGLCLAMTRVVQLRYDDALAAAR